MRWLRAQGLTVRFTTNNDSIPPAGLADRLARLGFPASEDELVTRSRSPPSCSPPHRRRGRWPWRRRGARAAGQLPGRAGRAGHPRLVADPSYRATYDDLAADIGGGHAVGAATVLVRSGKGDRPQPGAGAEPDAVVDSVADLPGLLQG